MKNEGQSEEKKEIFPSASEDARAAEEAYEKICKIHRAMEVSDSRTEAHRSDPAQERG